ILDRIGNCFEKLLQIRHATEVQQTETANAEDEQIAEHCISTAQFKLLIWYLLGIEEDLLPDSVFDKFPITFNFVKRNICVLFRRAVSENANDLLYICE